MSNTEQRPLRVFLNYASNDKPAVRKLYRRLLASGFDVWLDEEKLLPGQDWRVEIGRAVRSSDAVIICLSSSSVGKEGFVQKEIKTALNIAEEMPEGTFFLIPVKLEDCEVPFKLKSWQWVNLYEIGGYERLEKALTFRANTLTKATRKSTNRAEDLRKALAMTQREIAKIEQLATEYTVLTIPSHLVKELEEQRQTVSQLEVELSKLTPRSKSGKTDSRYDIFISYSRKDIEIMSRIKTHFEREGFNVWVDQSELELGTVAWETKIQDALEHTNCVVVLMSPDSKQSKWVMNELSYAERHDVRIFPVLARGDEVEAVPFRLSSTMWVDIREDYPKAMQKLVGAIRKQTS
jgi:hypothetical protein